MKKNSKPSFNTEIISTFKLQKSRLRMDKDNFKISYLEEKLVQNSKKPKELLKTLEYLGIISKEYNKLKISLSEEIAVRLAPRENANILKNFYSELSTVLVKKLLIAPNKFCSSTTENYCSDEFDNKKNEFKLLNISEDVVKKVVLHKQGLCG